MEPCDILMPFDAPCFDGHRSSGSRRGGNQSAAPRHGLYDGLHSDRAPGPGTGHPGGNGQSGAWAVKGWAVLRALLGLMFSWAAAGGAGHSAGYLV